METNGNVPWTTPINEVHSFSSPGAPTGRWPRRSVSSSGNRRMAPRSGILPTGRFLPDSTGTPGAGHHPSPTPHPPPPLPWGLRAQCAPESSRHRGEPAWTTPSPPKRPSKPSRSPRTLWPRPPSRRPHHPRHPTPPLPSRPRRPSGPLCLHAFMKSSPWSVHPATHPSRSSRS